MKKLPFYILSALCISLFSALTVQAATPWYRVELLIFANDDPDALDDEFWPADLDAPIKNNAVGLSQTQQNGTYRLIPNGDLLFTAEKSRIEDYQGFRVLFHGSWKQPVPSKRYAKSVHIRGGQLLDNGKYELDGYVTIDRGRYLHFRPDLYLNRQLNQQESSLLLQLESQKPETEAEISTTDALAPNSEVTTSTLEMGASELELPSFLTVQLNQGRRMRSKEVHYIDHPMMGVLVLMLPLKAKKAN